MLEILYDVGLPISYSQYCIAIFVIILFGFVGSYIYKCLFTRDVIIQDYSFFGYHAAGSHGGDRCREINDMRRQKRVGDCPPPYPNCWYAIAESDQIKQGQIKEVYALGHELIVWRGYSDKIFVSGAYCPHLGAHIGTGGTVVGADFIRCPFHHWSFNGSANGKVHHIPYTQGKVPESVKLTMWTSIEASGSIWIWYHADKEEPSYYPKHLEQIRNGEWVCKAAASNTVTCHFQEIPENAADVSHLNALHGDKVSPTFARRKSEPLPYLHWEFIRHVFSATWKKKEDPTRKHEYYFDGTHHIELFKKWKLFPRELHGRNVGPSQSFLHFDAIFGKAVLVITVTPQEPHLQLVTQRIYASRWFPQVIANFAMRTQQEQFQRDIGVWNRKMYIANPPLVKEDIHIKEFRRYMLQFYSKGSLPCQYKLRVEKGLVDF